MNFLRGLEHRLRGLTGWRRLLVAFACGAASALGFALVEFFPAMLLAYGALVLLLDGADRSEEHTSELQSH